MEKHVCFIFEVDILLMFCLKLLRSLIKTIKIFSMLNKLHLSYLDVRCDMIVVSMRANQVLECLRLKEIIKNVEFVIGFNRTF